MVNRLRQVWALATSRRAETATSAVITVRDRKAHHTMAICQKTDQAYSSDVRKMSWMREQWREKRVWGISRLLTIVATTSLFPRFYA